MKHKLNYGHVDSLSLFIITLLVSVFEVSSASALTYQSSTNVEFTLNPTISITLSAPNLIIDNLTPGSSNDSNIITVNISTNAGYGYYMSATAGTSTGNTDLTNQSSPSAKFTNLSSNVATLSSFPDNNWGYSYSTDNGTTWISGSEGNTSAGYNGLPLDNDDSGATGIILSSTDSFTNTGSIKFKIGAKASTTQASGTYTNTVNFYAVANPAPAAPTPTPPTSCAAPVPGLTYMQDLTSSNKATILSNMTEDSQYYLADKRDDKTYCVAKLRDGNLWMTQNLDLDIDSSRTYTNEDTDLGWNTQTNSYQTASWTPSRSTYATTTNNIHEWCQGGTYNTQRGYCENNNTPESYDPGDSYWNTTTSDWADWEAYYDSCNYSTTVPSCDESLYPLSTYVSSTGMQQYHLGNYYSWPAAIASNDASVYGAYNETTGEYENLETHQSICPAGWTLPYVSSDGSTSDFTTLWTEYGWSSNNYSFTDGISTVWSAPLYFAPAGYFNGNLGNTGNDGLFWSSVANIGRNAGDAYFGVIGYASPGYYDFRGNGNSIRCLLR